jgi:uncharacterized membrane protein
MSNGRWQAPLLLVLLLVCSPWTGLTRNGIEVDEEVGLKPEGFAVSAEDYHDFVGIADDRTAPDRRAAVADTRIGLFDEAGWQATRPLPAAWLQPRPDLRLVLVDPAVPMTQVRSELSGLATIEVRELLTPSGLLLQASPDAFDVLNGRSDLLAVHEVPIAMLLDDAYLDVLLLEGGAEALQGEEVRLEGWRGEAGPLAGVSLAGPTLHVLQEVSQVAFEVLEGPSELDAGRWRGLLATTDLIGLAMQPSLMWIGPEPVHTVLNDVARTNMEVAPVTNGFTTSLNGSGIIVAVADSGLDADHGDFGSRVLSSTDVVGDGSTADAHSGHGTHVSCTVLGDGSRGGYAGIAPQAELIFQAMENDQSGQFLSPSLNYILNQAYNAGARIHTNSWGSSQASDQGKYTSSSEDVDDRSNTYDRYYNGQEGLLVLFAAGNDGPGTGTVGSPSTAKNTLTVGNHQNRYGNAPDVMMSGSSRGPTDDGRIKPDVVAPGGYVRSCRAQEAQDIAGATWSSQYYLEYTGTSMATPNAAGAAALVREYLLEVAQRPAPQGALIKALLILGAEDIGTRNIPNDDEGWGRINLRDTLAPSGGRGIWVDDRSVLSRTGNSKTYVFNVTYANSPFKVVLAWSDERGNRFSTSQLVNDLDLEVIAPDNTTYLGNVFSNGRSIQAGSPDTVNNVEVVLIDAAQKGIWEVRVKDGNHGGSKAQPYAIAVSGQGVNDLRPDPLMVPDSLSMDASIPQVGDPVNLLSQVMNMGNVEAEGVDIAFIVDGTELDRVTLDLSPGAIRTLPWTWTPTVAGTSEVLLRVDPDDAMEEVQESNNDLLFPVNVSAPGVKVSANDDEQRVLTSVQTTSSWNVTLTNTALIGTNASLSAASVLRSSDGATMPWYVGLTVANFSLEGRGEAAVTVTVVHQAGPAPGTYLVPLIGLDVDNGVTYPYNLTLIVPSLAEARMTLDYSIVPLHPTEPTSFDVGFTNDGNGPIGYDLFLQAPTGWSAGFDDLGSEPGATSGSTGLMQQDAQRQVSITVQPPALKTIAGAERTVTLTAISQTDPSISTAWDIPMEVIAVRDVLLTLESNLGAVRPDASVALVFSLENRGNVDLELTPSFVLPSGWSMDADTSPISLSWTGSENVRYILNGDGSGRSGAIEVRFGDAEGRFTWASTIDVRDLPMPTLDFNRLLLEDGSSYDSPYGAGSHPAGEALQFTWLVGNDGSAPWTPTVALDLDPGLFGSCEGPGAVAPGAFEVLSCEVVLPTDLAAGAEASFRLVLDDGEVERSTEVGLLVAEVVAVRFDGPAEVRLDGETSTTASWTVTNEGNVRLQEVITLRAPSGWAAVLDGAASIDLEPGEAHVVRIDVQRDTDGEGTLTVDLGDTVPGGRLDVPLRATSLGSIDAESTSNVLLVGGATALIVLIGAAAVVLRGRRGPSSPPLAPVAFGGPSPPATPVKAAPLVQPTVAAAPVATPVHPVGQAQQVPCWGCRQMILGAMVGCPGCGARFHAPGNHGCAVPEACPNCGQASSSFVQA